MGNAQNFRGEEVKKPRANGSTKTLSTIAELPHKGGKEIGNSPLKFVRRAAN